MSIVSAPTPPPSANWNLKDRSTWIAIATVVAAVVLNVFHTDVSAYIPLAATIGASIVVAFTTHAKHTLTAAHVNAQATASYLASKLPRSVPEK